VDEKKRIVQLLLLTKTSIRREDSFAVRRNVELILQTESKAQVYLNWKKKDFLWIFAIESSWVDAIKACVFGLSMVASTSERASG
jgi:hypothetical protein